MNNTTMNNTQEAMKDTTMENTTITFEQLPQLVAALIGKVDYLISLFKQVPGSKASADPAQVCNPHRMMDAKEASRFIGKAIPTIYAMTSRNEIPFCKKGNKLYFFEDELTEWIEGGCEDMPTKRTKAKEERLDSHNKKILESKHRKPKSGFDDDSI